MASSDLFSGTNLAVLRGGRPVFAGLDFALAPGCALRLAGPNGSGKSTLIRIMAGLLRPSVGQVCWGGTPIDRDREGHAARLAFLGHQDALKPALTAWENAAFAARVRGGRTTRLAGAFEALDLTALKDLPAGWLSSGQKRRTALAGLIATGAELWLLDEPTVGLDSAAVGNLEAAIARHLAAGGRVVAATHTALDLGPGAIDLDPASFQAAGSIAEFGPDRELGWG